MVANSRLIFRPSIFHRISAALLCMGSWMVGVRGLFMMVEYMPKVLVNIQIVKMAGEPTCLFWAYIVFLAVSCLVGGLLLATSILGFILIEGTNIVVDKIGITVAYTLLPKRLAVCFGAGYIPWNQVVRLEKRGVFFVLHSGQSSINGSGVDSSNKFGFSVKFIIVYELERLVLTIMQYSRNMTFL
jgi:hypothetical protein